MVVLASLEVLFKSNYREVTDGLKAIDTGMKTLAMTSGQTAEAFATMGLGAVQLGGVLKNAVIDPLIDIGRESINAAAQMKGAEISFANLTGSAQEAGQMMKDLVFFAEKTPFEIPGVLEASKRMMAMGFEAKELIPVMTVLGDTVSAVAGGSQESLNRAVLAIGQMRASGTVMKQELNQLKNLGIDAAGILAEKLNLTGSQVANIGKMQIDSVTAVNALLEGLFERFGGGMKKMADQGLTAFAEFNDAITLFKVQLGNELLPIITPIVQVITQNIKVITGYIKEAIQELKDFFTMAQYMPVVGGMVSSAMNAMREMEARAKAGGGPGLPALTEAPSIGPRFSPDDLIPASGGMGGGGGIVRGGSGRGSTGTRGAKPPEDWIAAVHTAADVDPILKWMAGEAFKGSKASAEELKAVVDDLGQTMSDAERQYAGMLEDNAKDAAESAELWKDVWIPALKETGTDLDYFGQAADNAATLGKSMSGLDGVTREVSAMFSTVSEAIKTLKFSFDTGAEVIDKLFPRLEHASDLYDKMFKQSFQLFEGAYGPGVLPALRSFSEQQESNLKLLQFMEAAGFGAQSASAGFDSLTASMGGMDTAFDDLLASFTNHAAATNAVADNLQAVADQQLVSVSMGMAGAQAASNSLNSGLVQLGAGLGAYGQMAASGTLPGGLPGGVPDFTGGGIGFKSGPGLAGGTTGGSITNPFDTGTPWGGGVHGFPPGPGGNWGGGTIVMMVDGQAFGRVTNRVNSWSAFNNAIGVRAG